MSKREVIFGVFVAIVGFVGAIGGVIIGSKMEQSNWEVQRSIAVKEKLTSERMVILKEFIDAYTKLPRVVASNIRFQAYAKQTGENIDCLKKYEQVCYKFTIEDEKVYREMSKDIFDEKAKIEKLILLGQLYFGEKTKTAILELVTSENYNWLEPNNELVNKIVFSMKGDLFI